MEGNEKEVILTIRFRANRGIFGTLSPPPSCEEMSVGTSSNNNPASSGSVDIADFQKNIVVFAKLNFLLVVLCLFLDYLFSLLAKKK